MRRLLDSNVLIALALADHIHHAQALAWLRSSDAAVATCPTTQGALIRTLLRLHLPQEQALRDLQRITDLGRHEFWPDDLSYAEVRMAGVVGHRQVTDAYLAALSRVRGRAVGDLRQGPRGAASDVVELVPSA